MGWLAGFRVQKVQVTPSGVAMRVRGQGETAHVIVVATASGPAVGATEARPHLGAPDARAQAALRKLLTSAVVIGLEERRVLLETLSGVVAVTPRGAVVAVIPVEGDAAIVDGRAATGSGVDGPSRDAWMARGETLTAHAGGRALDGARVAAAQAFSRAISKVDKRLAAIRGDLARIDAADSIAARAALFVAEAARAPRGARALTTTDWSTGEAVVVELALDPARGARDQVDDLFRRARRLKLGAAVARERLEASASAAARLRDVAARLAGVSSVEDVAALVAEARAAAPRDVKLAEASVARRRDGDAPSLPYKTFLGAGDARILVGRGAAHNDALTFRAARPHDLWLHAKGFGGAHVIVPLEKKKTCPAELLVDAAHLAAHFSDARGEPLVEIQHVERRHLRKPRGAAPGFVVVDRERVMTLRVIPERLAELLAREA